MTEGLLRQRRSLMVTSMIIILLSFGGVKIEEVGALGTQLTFERKDALYLGIWVVFVYFLARYYQYVREEQDLGIAKAYWGKVNAMTFLPLIDVAVEKYSLDRNHLSGEFQFSELKRKSAFVRVGNVATDRTVYGDQAHSPYEVNILRFLPAYAWAAIHIVVNRSVITDYVVPFVLAIVAAVCGVSSDWEGSPVRIFFGAQPIGRPVS